MHSELLNLVAVSTLSHARARAPLATATLSPVVLMLTLIAPALDLLARVQPASAVPVVGLLATGLAGVVLVLNWVRYPRTSWLAAATLAALASAALRLMGAEVAPLMSLLAVVALGIGGAFASPPREAEAWLA
ncbi:MAG: hypothetical protein LC797_23640 [Chloroflexi bacterium]|nr:hypothetical protein [Chloroflexota bacterium]